MSSVMSETEVFTNHSFISPEPYWLEVIILSSDLEFQNFDVVLSQSCHQTCCYILLIGVLSTSRTAAVDGTDSFAASLLSITIEKRQMMVASLFIQNHDI